MCIGEAPGAAGSRSLRQRRARSGRHLLPRRRRQHHPVQGEGGPQLPARQPNLGCADRHRPRGDNSVQAEKVVSVVPAYSVLADIRDGACMSTTAIPTAGATFTPRVNLKPVTWNSTQPVWERDAGKDPRRHLASVPYLTALAAHPGKSQGPPPKSTDSRSIVHKRPARLRSPQQEPPLLLGEPLLRRRAGDSCR